MAPTAPAVATRPSAAQRGHRRRPQGTPGVARARAPPLRGKVALAERVSGRAALADRLHRNDRSAWSSCGASALPRNRRRGTRAGLGRLPPLGSNALHPRHMLRRSGASRQPSARVGASERASCRTHRAHLHSGPRSPAPRCRLVPVAAISRTRALRGRFRRRCLADPTPSDCDGFLPSGVARACSLVARTFTRYHSTLLRPHAGVAQVGGGGLLRHYGRRVRSNS